MALIRIYDLSKPLLGLTNYEMFAGWQYLKRWRHKHRDHDLSSLFLRMRKTTSAVHSNTAVSVK